MKYIFILLFPFTAFAQTVCSTGLEAFTKTLHPQLRQSCFRCHGTDSEVPSHSHEDPKEAYLVSKSLVDFNALEKSQFVLKVRSKHWLKYSANAKGMTEEKMLELLSAWYQEGEQGCPAQDFAYVTSFTKLPVTLGEKFEKLRWQISSEAMAEIEIQKFKEEGDGTVSFRLRKPRIASRENVHVRGIHLVINQQTNPLENAFTQIDHFIAGKDETRAEILPFPMLSIENLITFPRHDSTPEIGLAFEKLDTRASLPGCKNFELFETNLLPEIKHNCLGCHSDSSNVAGQRFSMQLPVEELCQEFTLRQRTLYELAIKGRLEHPPITQPQQLHNFKKNFVIWRTGN